MRSVGILAALLDLNSFDKLYSHPVFGSCWEGFAIENILAMLKPKGLYGFFRTHSGEEIDLVIKHNDKNIGFEFKMSSSPKLSDKNLSAFKMLELDKLYVVVPGGSAYPIDGDNIWVTPLKLLNNDMVV